MAPPAGRRTNVGIGQGPIGGVSEAGGLGQIDTKTVATALVAAGHFRAGVAELLLDVALVDLGRGGEAGAQRIEFRQTNSETQLIDWVHEAIDNGAGIIINPAAYTFTSLALFDALKMFAGPIIELHISNVHKREAMYHNSLVSKVATAIIAGLGAKGYPAAVRAMRDLIQ